MSTKSYTLSHRAPFNQDWRRTYHEDAAQALLAAWRNRRKGWLVDSVAKGPHIVLDDVGLARALDRMDELLSESPKATPREAAVQALREVAGAGSPVGLGPE